MNNKEKIELIESIRKKKTEKLKSKILLEIEEKSVLYKEVIKNDVIVEEYENAIKTLYVLICLKDYICYEHSFNHYMEKSLKDNYIIYWIDDKLIDIWLQENYNFTNQFLCNAIRMNLYVTHMLNDEYFGKEFTNIYDIINYNKGDE